ncbi:MAG TPA: energy-coupled thiamine transporter ThiT [Candidatus Galloscillospira excrementavium]|mgnify:CR=1 FL=1|nr:energy-coupled thiamine transporter ThiT [Candidatus Galloscillospira excrementavium]
MTRTKATATRWLVESAIMIAIGTILSEWPKIDYPLGGGLTICSMLPLVLISFRFGVKRGLTTALAYSLLQLVLGLDNVQYATSAGMAAAIVLLDYIVPYTVIGLAGAFKSDKRDLRVNLVLGIVVTFILRLVCHFFTGWLIWDALWPNEYGWSGPVYSILYNGSYMVSEMILTSVVAVALCSTPLRRYFNGDDLK